MLRKIFLLSLPGLVLLTLLTTVPAFCRGQIAPYDSLLNVYHSISSTDSAKVKAVVGLGGTEFRRQNPDSLIKLQDQAEYLVKILGTPVQQGTLAQHRALALKYLGKYSESLSVLEDGEVIAREHGDTIRLIKILHTKATCYLDLNDFSNSVAELERAMLLAETIGHEYFTAVIKASLGANSLSFGEFTKARNYFLDHLNMAEERKDHLGMVSALTNIGYTYMEEQNYEDALSSYTRAYDLVEEHELWHVAGTTLLNVGESYLNLGDRDRALTFFMRGLSSAKKQSELAAVARGNGQLAKFYRQEKPDSALFYAKEALRVADEIGSQEVTEKVAEVTYRLYENFGDYENALNYYKLWKNTYDSTYNQDVRKDILLAETRYQFEKQQLANRLAYEQSLTEQKLKTQAITYASIGGGLLIGALFFMLWKDRKQRSERERTTLLNKITVLRERIIARSLHQEDEATSLSLNRTVIENKLGQKLGETSWNILRALEDDHAIKNNEIAEKIHLSLEGVSSSLRRMYKRFDVESTDSRNLKISLLKKAMQLSLDDEEQPLNGGRP